MIRYILLHENEGWAYVKLNAEYFYRPEKIGSPATCELDALFKIRDRQDCGKDAVLETVEEWWPMEMCPVALPPIYRVFKPVYWMKDMVAILLKQMEYDIGNKVWVEKDA